MDVESLSALTEERTLHRSVVGNYAGPYALGVTLLPNRKAALLLSIPETQHDLFPKTIDVQGEPIEVIVETEWTPPKPL